ncbi:cytochrome c [uncultured Flavobacterium sp.]|uniref:c-type cytochrome n=1 Tax=uncultured Flavobacterium sp. TaxID=165435 RepID=UPI0030EB5B17|tara:strand:+ start:8765 stop:9220 length:456 start_codon:yes stop_codon:yes gene_type:complete
MIITKLHFGIALFASAYLYYSNPSVSSKTNYLPILVIQQQTPLQKSIADGKEVYADFCMQCHLVNGKGDGVNFPTLDGSNWLTEKRTQSIHALKFGLSGPIVVNGKKFKSAMPAMGLSNQEVTDVMNYIMNSWSNKQKKSVSLEEVALVKK